MKLKGIIFDIDGTLTDSLPICIKAFQEAVETCTGRRISDSDVSQEFGPTEEGIMKILVPEMPDKGVEVYLSAYERLCTEALPHVDGLNELLDTLKSRGLKLAVVTGKGKGSTDITLDILGISHFFDQVAYGSPNGGIKAESIKAVVSAWGFKGNEVAYVGDVESDVQAALDAGVVPVLATWIENTDLHVDCQVFSDVDSFVKWAVN